MITRETHAAPYPSIFNDVIGPVMRGPSSSHCAAAVRIGAIAREMMAGTIDSVLIEFHPGGSLATTHETQGSDMGLFAGLVGLQPDDDNLVASAELLRKAGVDVTIQISDFPAEHPNTYKITLVNGATKHTIIALSTGGGGILIKKIDSFAVSLRGDYYETLIFHHETAASLISFLKSHTKTEVFLTVETPEMQLLEVKSHAALRPQLLSQLRARFQIAEIMRLSPVLPVLSRRDMSVPFSDIAEMLRYNVSKNLSLAELAVHYESSRGGISFHEVREKMRDVVGVMRNSIETGIDGTSYADRILGYQSGPFKDCMENGVLLEGGMLNRMILYVTAMMEQKSSMGIIVAAPTAGSCGVLPGACVAAADYLGRTDEEITEAMLAAGLIGVFISSYATFAAEIGGCQAECGAGSGMAAAALITLKNGTLSQALSAVSMALQNIFGMTCDPVANRVEVPCLGKNIMAAANALSCANMALANFDAVIPLDEVLSAMNEVGKSLPRELRCTALGGLSITETSRDIERRLNAGTG